MPKSGLNVALKGLDDIFSTEESRQEEQREQVQQIPVSELFPFKNHPFKVLDDDSMTRTVESISQFGNACQPLLSVAEHHIFYGNTGNPVRRNNA